MIIEEIMKKIWQPVTDKYMERYNHYLEQDLDELFKSVKVELKSLYSGISSEDYNENIIPTPGCPHKNRNGIFSGCSMCNWETENVDLFAKIAVIRNKNKKLYTDVLMASFEQNRGLGIKPSVIEEIATHDAFDESTFPEEAFEQFFEKKMIFKKRPLYGIVAARASNITEAKLNKWKKEFRNQLMVGMGVEVSNEWIRNHLINKNSTNQEIIKAVEEVKNTGCHITADILLGIPGLSDGHAMNVFEETCKWLLALDVDNILVSPLSRKEYTLQDYLFKNFIGNQNLEELNIVDGYLTSIPRIFMIIEGLYRVLKNNPNIADKLILSPQNFKNYEKIIEEYSRMEKLTESEKIIMDALREITLKNMSQSGISRECIIKLREEVVLNEEYRAFLKNIDEQSKVEMKDSVFVLITEIAKQMWPDEYQEKVEAFKNEMVNESLEYKENDELC